MNLFINKIRGASASKAVFTIALGLSFVLIFGSVAFAEFTLSNPSSVVGYGYGYGYGDSGYGYGYGYGTGLPGFTGGGGPNNGGGNSGGGSGSGTGGGQTGGSTSGGGSVLGASTDTGTTTVPWDITNGPLCQSDWLIKVFLKRGANNPRAEVIKLQAFLNTQKLGITLKITAVFDAPTEQAVKLFQLKYANEVLGPWVAAGRLPANTATGYVYKTTLRWINHLICLSNPLAPVQL